MRARRRLALAAMLTALLLFVGLGIWQIARRNEKLGLIAQVERRLAADPVPAPGPAAWPRIDRGDAYTRVAATGRWRRGADSFVLAVTTLGSGYWVMTPLDTAGGWTLIVNRGFVPADRRDTLPPPPGAAVAITGLLRLSEPGGGFLRANRPDVDRWYSRDVAALAKRHRIAGAAPYFIDADRTGEGWPRGGMTVVRFANSHLIYILTWFALAALTASQLPRVMRAGGRST